MTSKSSERNGINSDINGADVDSERNAEKELDTLLNMNRGHRVEPPALKVVEPPSISKGNKTFLTCILMVFHVSIYVFLGGKKTFTSGLPRANFILFFFGLNSYNIVMDLNFFFQNGKI